MAIDNIKRPISVLKKEAKENKSNPTSDTPTVDNAEIERLKAEVNDLNKALNMIIGDTGGAK